MPPYLVLLAALGLGAACPGPGGDSTTDTTDTVGSTSGQSSGAPVTDSSGGTSTGSGPVTTSSGETSSTGSTGSTSSTSSTGSSTSSSGSDGSSSGSDGSSSGSDGCLEGGVDQDSDGYADACDNCPADANPLPPQELPWNNQMQAVSDWDEDGLGNVCDDCPHSKGPGAVPGENCCDPRSSQCNKMYAGSTILFKCHPYPDGERFGCDSGMCSASYRQACFGCDGPCVPVGALEPAPGCAPGSSCDCSKHSCLTQYCTVGDDAPCKDSNVCIPWFKPGEAPPGLEQLGICARTDQGACVGKAGIECATWTNFTLK